MLGERMHVCSLCSLPRTLSFEREEARLVLADTPSDAVREPVPLAQRSELPGIEWVKTSAQGRVLLVRAQMRGVLQGDLHLSVEDGLLLVDALVHEPGRDYCAPGRTYRHKFHVCLVGEEVDDSGIQATFRNGQLQVQVPLLREEAHLRGVGDLSSPEPLQAKKRPSSSVVSLAGLVHLLLR